ncbi:hypothetical protein KsCSTR_30370 [Candidatus Kuenenia stuttgartiensis]|uniref:YcfA-like protein n=1 Tax=Kuenenia stuttgartiensis TaxID=174633 RepID=Q1Q5H3_KUEST|nr:hypothetical protein KsCSTR_30370 [Candidatus Kuenenia stuttgartiensis]CAJ75266.1 conserved hypothetical protein [Candidatus Kuenenia stuttgartiensis]
MGNCPAKRQSYTSAKKHTAERTLKLTVPTHNPIKRFTLSHIIKQAHLSVYEFKRLL